MAKHKTLFNWSSGKDSAISLYKLLQNSEYKVERILTTVNSHYNRVTMHGLRNELLFSQAHELDVPLDIIELPEQPSMEMYNRLMVEKLYALKQEDYTHSAFGDIFLEDLKAYREQQLSSIGIEAVFPIWRMNTTELVNEFIDLGFKAIVVAASSKYFNESFLGTSIDSEFINKLPKNVDPCGENGEFHTFCYGGPIFKNEIKFSIGETIYKTYKNPDKEDQSTLSGFWYLDLLPYKS